MKKSANRMRIISSFVVLFALLVVWNLFNLQVKNGENIREQADNQYVTPTTAIFERGNIMMQSKDGELLSLATQKSGYKVSISPNSIFDPEKVYERINLVVPLNKEEFLAKANKQNDSYEEILWELDKETADKLKKVAESSVQVHKEKIRYYPGGEIAAHTVGFLGYKGDDLAGRYGLERSYEDVLARSDSNLYVNFFAEVFSDIKSLVSGNEFEGDIITTIEPTVQVRLEKSIKKLDEKWNPDGIHAIVMNPQDGSIYAMASFPTFNVNDFRNADPAYFKNPIVEDVFEPGSIMKPIIMAIAFDKGLVTAETPFFDPGKVTVEGHEIHNFDDKGRGQVTLQEVLGQSLNTGMVFVMDKLKKSDVRKYMKAFGFEEKTGIDLPNEVRGLTSNLKSNRDIEFANISFGQGIAISPIAMARAVAVLANGGYKVTPHVVEKIKYTNGFTKTLDFPKDEERVIKKETSEEISRMLVQIIDTSFLGGIHKIEHHNIAIKTGTAQVPDPTGGYYENKKLHSFFGYFPAYDPEFLIMFYLENPKGVKYSSQTLFDPFMDLTKFILNYYNIAPDR